VRAAEESALREAGLLLSMLLGWDALAGARVRRVRAAGEAALRLSPLLSRGGAL